MFIMGRDVVSVCQMINILTFMDNKIPNL